MDPTNLKVFLKEENLIDKEQKVTLESNQALLVMVSGEDFAFGPEHEVQLVGNVLRVKGDTEYRGDKIHRSLQVEVHAIETIELRTTIESKETEDTIKSELTKLALAALETPTAKEPVVTGESLVQGIKAEVEQSGTETIKSEKTLEALAAENAAKEAFAAALEPVA